jgi:hypothetical protein
MKDQEDLVTALQRVLDFVLGKEELGKEDK